MKTNKELLTTGSKIASLFPWVLYAIACICTIYHTRNGSPFWLSYLQAVVFFNAGIQGLWASIGHLFFPHQTAKAIGWKSSGFQTEVGSMNLGFGLTGVLSYFFPMWAIPVALIVAIFYAGCAYVHIKERIQVHNDAPCNSGPMLYNTIWVSLTLLISLIVIGAGF